MSLSGVTRGADRSLGRAFLVSLALMLAVGGYLMTAQALSVREAGASVTEAPRPVPEQPWKDSYSRRFPGCVPAVLWPARRTPARVVVQWGDRTVQRVELGGALRRALSANGTDAGRVIGACYR